MSSSRSIAAARNRRAGDPVQQQPQQSRPNTSIGSSAVFSQPPQQSQYGKQSNTTTTTQNVPFSKITISDAIGLITLRLGKVEQYIIDTHGEGERSSLPENTQLVDNSVLTSIINRLDSIEKRDIQTGLLLSKIGEDLLSLNAKFDAYVIETNGKLDDIDNAFAELEQNTIIEEKEPDVTPPDGESSNCQTLEGSF